MQIEQFLTQSKLKAEQNLAKILAPLQTTALGQAMEYSCLNGGKRLRAALVYAVGNMLAAETEEALATAATAVELIHAFSLIHDDLPAMDDDELRRGKPTCHIKFDEATAILAGDALQTLAFETLSKPINKLNNEIQLRMLKTLAIASGASGMAGGQHIDVRHTNKQMSQLELENMHALKTGKLISASVSLGQLASKHANNSKIHAALTVYSQQIGIAFQIQDDILDYTASTEQLGKSAGKDQQQNKATYTTIFGVKKAKQIAQEACDTAIQNVAKLEFDSTILQEIARYIIRRTS